MRARDRGRVHVRVRGRLMVRGRRTEHHIGLKEQSFKAPGSLKGRNTWPLCEILHAIPS